MSADTGNYVNFPPFPPGALAFPTPVDVVDVTLLVGQRLRKTARVCGPRHWEPDVMANLVPSRPRPTTRVPIDWALSFGGVDPTDPGHVERRNPAGTGVGKSSEALVGRPAPQYDDPLRPITSQKDRAAPIGFGALAPHWPPRLARAGTYDERWRAERSPLPPEDMDARFFNVAPDDQQLPSYVAGEELRLVYGGQQMKAWFALPALEVPVTFLTGRSMLEAETRVDTVILAPETNTLTVVARAAFVPVPNVLAFRETIVGALSRGHRRALESGRRYLGRGRR
jgi:hypothetical protein